MKHLKKRAMMQENEELELEYKNLYEFCRKNNCFTHIIDFDNLINDEQLDKSQYDDFIDLVESKIREVEDGTLNYNNFFKVLEMWEG